MWKLRYKNEIYKYFNESPQIKIRRLQWAGHVQRMDGGRISNRIFEGEHSNRRPIGRPRREGLMWWEKAVKSFWEFRN